MRHAHPPEVCRLCRAHSVDMRHSIVAAVHLGVGLSIVNLDYVIGIQNGEIIMRGFTVPVAKQSYRKFREYYLDYCFKK